MDVEMWRWRLWRWLPCEVCPERWRVGWLDLDEEEGLGDAELYRLWRRGRLGLRIYGVSGCVCGSSYCRYCHSRDDREGC